MNKQILESVISLTKNNDLDYAGISLLSTIAEYVYFKKACLVELERSWPNPVVNNVLELRVQSHEPHFDWHANQCLAEPPMPIITAIDSLKCSITENKDGNMELWLPITGTENKLALHLTAETLTAEDKSLISAFSRMYGNYLKVLLENEKDNLTGLLNRHSFEHNLHQMLSKQASLQERQQGKMPQREDHQDVSPWLVILDIDHLKKVKDFFGYVCGNEVLLTLSQKLGQYFRTSDYLFCLDGEEFVVILEPATRSEAYKQLNDFRQVVADERFPLVGKITISIGFTKASKDEYEHVLMENADRAVYYAKVNGRNTVYCYEQLVEDGRISEKPAQIGGSYIDVFQF